MEMKTICRLFFCIPKPNIPLCRVESKSLRELASGLLGICINDI